MVYGRLGGGGGGGILISDQEFILLLSKIPNYCDPIYPITLIYCGCFLSPRLCGS